MISFYRALNSLDIGDSYMKVLYGINTNGQGHINRSSVVISQLMKDGHDVHVLLSGKIPPIYAYDISPIVFYRSGPIDFYKDNKMLISKSLRTNFGKYNEFAKIVKEMVELDRKENFDFIISDFERTSSLVGKRLNKPVIVIDRQHSLLHPSVVEAPKKNYEMWAVKLAFSMINPYYYHIYVLDYCYTIDTQDDITLFPLIWKPELENYKIRTSNHIVVYLPRSEPNELIDIFTKFPKETFYVYGFNVEKQINNVHLKLTSREGFLEDLTSCKAIIGNAGFNLTWEACLLNKLIWTIPHSNQYEQLANAFRLQKLNQSFVSNDFTEIDLKNFLEWAKRNDYHSENNLPILTASDLLTLVYEDLENYESENFLTPRQIRQNIKYDVNRWRLRKEIRKEIQVNTSYLEY